jgi:hypothetical protein
LAPLFLLFFEETSSADRFVHLRSSNQFDFLALHDSLGEGGLSSAVDAHCAQFGDLLSEWDQIDDISKGFAFEGAIEGRDHDNFVHIGQGLAELNDFREKLALVDSNDIIFGAKINDLHELVGLEGLFSNSG